MPWHISSNRQECSGYAVVKDDDDSIVGCHSSESEAKAQLSALYASESKKNLDKIQNKIWDGIFFPK